MPWTHAVAPARVEIRFDGFRVSSDAISVDTTAAPVALPAEPEQTPAVTADTSAGG
mgnify:FL=1